MTSHPTARATTFLHQRNDYRLTRLWVVLITLHTILTAHPYWIGS